MEGGKWFFTKEPEQWSPKYGSSNKLAACQAAFTRTGARCYW